MNCCVLVGRLPGESVSIAAVALPLRAASDAAAWIKIPDHGHIHATVGHAAVRPEADGC